MNAVAWHEGERALHARAGIAERMAEIGPRVLRDHMPQQHRSFFAQLSFLIAGSQDEKGRPWASVLAAPPGFAHSYASRRNASWFSTCSSTFTATIAFASMDL